MNSYSNDDAKEQIRMRADIVSVVSRYTELKGHGDSLKGLCPFHKEKTPSFTVSPSRGTYKCFGCGEGGDVFKFIQTIEGIDFREALVKLADETGVILSSRSDKPGGRSYGSPSSRPPSNVTRPMYKQPAPPDAPPVSTMLKKEMLDMHEEAAAFFYGRVKGNQTVIDYFKQRGLRAETVREFRLGYAPDGWSELCDHFKAKGVAPHKVVECGFAIRKDDKGGITYDRFRNRIIFPLYDTSGRVIAFAGRAMSKDEKAKYLNSPETALYKKSQVLYGLHKARSEMRDRGFLMIVEGYMDFLTLYQAGIKNAVAVSGTAFTEDHARIIKRLTRKVTFVFDGDRAGQAAAQKALFVLAPFGLQASVLTLPAGDDPDSFVKREGSVAFRELLASATAAEDFLIDKFIAESDDTPQGKSHIVTELMPYAHSLDADAIVRDAFLVKLARKLDVAESHIRDRFEETRPAPSYNAYNDAQYYPTAPEEPYYIDTQNMPDDPYYQAAQSEYPHGVQASAGNTGGAADVLEENFLKILIQKPEFAVYSKMHVTPEFFLNKSYSDIYSTILDVYARDGNLDGLREAHDGRPDIQNRIDAFIEELRGDTALLENLENELVQKIVLLRRRKLKEQMRLLSEELKNCADDRKNELFGRLNDCVAQLKELDS